MGPVLDLDVSAVLCKSRESRKFCLGYQCDQSRMTLRLTEDPSDRLLIRDQLRALVTTTRCLAEGFAFFSASSQVFDSRPIRLRSIDIVFPSHSHRIIFWLYESSFVWEILPQ